MNNHNDSERSEQLTSEIEARRMNFDVPEQLPKYWYNDNPLISSFFSALSATFPDGERFFIHSVRHYRDRVTDPVLKRRIQGFIGQEAHHGHSHEAFNAAIGRSGLPIERVERSIHKHLEFLKRHLGPRRQLAITAALEHLTATFAEHVLTHTEQLDRTPPVFRQMIIWHAVEEIEHKSVAFDVYRQQVGNEWLRRQVMFIALHLFFMRLAYYQYLLLKDEGWPSLKQWWQAFRFFWGKGGMMRHSVRSFLHYFRRDFHPDDIDQRPLIDDWQRHYPDVAALQLR